MNHKHYTYYLDCVFADTQGVPQLDALVSGARHDLTVVGRESNTQHILGVSHKAAGSCASVNIESSSKSSLLYMIPISELKGSTFFCFPKLQILFSLSLEVTMISPPLAFVINKQFSSKKEILEVIIEKNVLQYCIDKLFSLKTEHSGSLR